MNTIVSSFNNSFFLKILLASLILISISGCDSNVRGGSQTIIEDQVDISGVTLRVNNFSGSDDADGIEIPYQSLQFALNQLRPGDTLLIERGAGPYKYLNLENPQDQARTKQGFKLTVSGSKDLPITIKGDPVLNSIIDQEGQSIGLFLDCVSNVIIKDLEIRNTLSAGISSAMHGGCETSNIIIQENFIHNVNGNKFVSGVRMMGVNDLIISNNQIENITKDTSLSDTNFDFVDWGQGVSNLTIEGNIISSVETGVIINAQGFVDNILFTEHKEAVSSLKISDNIFRTLQAGISFDAKIPSINTNSIFKVSNFENVDFYLNIFDDVNNNVIAVDSGDTLFQSENFCIFNNTLVNSSPNFLDLIGVKNIEIYNNVLDVLDAVVLKTTATENTQLINSVTYSDYNFYVNSSILSWEMDFGGPSYEVFPALSQWQSASRQDLIINPDLNSISSIPIFVDTENDDYRLSNQTPASILGRDGIEVGYNFALDVDYQSNCRDDS